MDGDGPGGVASSWGRGFTDGAWSRVGAGLGTARQARPSGRWVLEGAWFHLEGGRGHTEGRGLLGLTQVELQWWRGGVA